MENSQESVMGTPSDAPKPGTASSTAPVAVGRRRLIKAGAAAVPVAATLVSRPAFAWHGKTPSAWGSEQLNPAASVKAMHESFADETWTVSNWSSNSGRSDADLTAPWGKLSAAYPNLKTLQASRWQKRAAGSSRYFSYKNVTLGDLFASVLPLQRPVGSIDSAKSAADWFASNGASDAAASFAARIIIAQLNHLMLAGSSDLGRVVTLADLKKMASLQYAPNTSKQRDTPWDAGTVVNYLRANWIVVA